MAKSRNLILMFFLGLLLMTYPKGAQSMTTWFPLSCHDTAKTLLSFSPKTKISTGFCCAFAAAGAATVGGLCILANLPPTARSIAIVTGSIYGAKRLWHEIYGVYKPGYYEPAYEEDFEVYKTLSTGDVFLTNIKKEPRRDLINRLEEDLLLYRQFLLAGGFQKLPQFAIIHDQRARFRPINRYVSQEEIGVPFSIGHSMEGILFLTGSDRFTMEPSRDLAVNTWTEGFLRVQYSNHSAKSDLAKRSIRKALANFSTALFFDNPMLNENYLDIENPSNGSAKWINSVNLQGSSLRNSDDEHILSLPISNLLWKLRYHLNPLFHRNRLRPLFDRLNAISSGSRSTAVFYTEVLNEIEGFFADTFVEERERQEIQHIIENHRREMGVH